MTDRRTFFAEAQMRVLVFVTFLGAATATAGGQAPETLPPADLRFPEPFSQLAPGTLRELRDGRVLVADARDRVLYLVDLQRENATSLSNEGNGPREFAVPMRLLGITADSTLLYDQGNQRYLLLGPRGEAITSFRPEVGAVGGGNMRFLVAARGSDAQGRLYVESAPAIATDGTPATADSSAILRWDRRSNRVDTMAYVRVLPQRVESSGTSMRVSMGGGNPLTPRDEWVVFPSGRIAIVRHDPYRVDFIEPNGQRTVGRPLPYTRERLTNADKAEEEDRRRRRQAELASRGGMALPGGVTMQASDPSRLPPLGNWPEYRPPFRPGYVSVLARPNGETWIQRMQPAGSRGTLIDVIGADGTRLRQVRLEPQEVLVGFGQRAIYTATVDDDGAFTLARHPH